MPHANKYPQYPYPANDFIVKNLPGWLKGASQAQIKALRSAVLAHQDSQRQMADMFKQLQPLDRFAKDRLQPAIKTKLGVQVDFATALWREKRIRVTERPFQPIPGLLPPDFETRFVDQPLLQKLLQNFKPGESFDSETVVLKAAPIGNAPTQTLTADTASLAQLSREQDVGGAYQAHLEQVLSPAFAAALAADKRHELALAVEFAAIRGQLDNNDVKLLRLLAQGKQAHHAQGWTATGKGLQILGCRVDGAVAYELREPPRRQSDFPAGPPDSLKAVILYLPGFGTQPLRRFTDWAAVNLALVEALADDGFKQALAQRIELSERAGYLSLLATRLSDPEPDVQAQRLTVSGNLFVSLADWHVKRMKADARLLAVPTAMADRAAADERLARLESAGLALLSLAGLFVPVIGALLLVDMARQLLDEVYEGVSDWSQGHRHEALTHLLEVLTSVALLGAVSLGVHTARSAFVESLEPVTTEAGTQRLWRNDLARYRRAPAGMALSEGDDGLFVGGQGHWWHNEGTFYRVRQDARGSWRLLHDEGPGTYGPPLRGNAERGWWLSSERPLEWQGQGRLLTRLWPAARLLDAERVEQILVVAGVDEDGLRRLLVERRPLPVALRDTLERFAVQARNEAFFNPSDEGPGYIERLLWCRERLNLQALTDDEQLQAIADQADALRQPMLDHFAEQYLADDPAMAVLLRHFPSLPKAYALDILKGASPQMRVTLLEDHRVPLVLSQRARAMLQEVRLVRLREALYLRGSYRDDLVSLVFTWAQKQGLAADQINLVLRDRTSSGAVLERLLPAFGTEGQSLDMVWNDGAFTLYDARGLPSELEAAEPGGVFEVLAATLAPSFLQKLEVAGEDLPGQIRAKVQGWLPRERKALLDTLGWREARPQGATLQRFGDGRIGYPLGPVLSCLDSPECTMRRRIRDLYPSFAEDEVERYLEMMYRRSSSPFSSLLMQEMEYDHLDDTLRIWARHTDPLQRERRVQVSDVFRRAWRMEGARIVRAGEPGWSTGLTVTSVPLGDLPMLPPYTDFAHIVRLNLSNLQLAVLPPGFLRSFPRLRTLDLSYNNLRMLPAGLGRLRELEELNLSGNRIRLTAAQAEVVAGMTGLRRLDLSDNLIGTTVLSVGDMQHLESLILRRTGLRDMPEGLERCQRLTYADLRNNQIGELPLSLLSSPVRRRQVMVLSGNPLAGALREQLGADPVSRPPSPTEPETGQSQARWLGALADDARGAAQRQWQALRAEEGSAAFFGLLDDYVYSAEFRAAPGETGRRVWQVIAAASDDPRMRRDLFDLAADPRTCADSTAHCFSQVEVGMHVSQFTHNGEPAATATERLLLAQRLFRLHEVERLARADMDARYADGRWLRGEHDEEEVEVSLAYRVGLASRLDLLGQPREMLFGGLARVDQADLDRAYTAVLDAEATQARAVFISEREFWIASLRALHTQAFTEVEDDFQRRWDALESQWQTPDDSQLGLGDPEYLRRARALREEREQALGALTLRLTQEALQTPVTRSPARPSGQTGHPD
ncbi:NEL-type E3 ubiquitin ligase domain-containing protein [Pseudomonas sp. NPDC086566]|uniref:NEL-type E3 ubiquitin ligase domain-containing protein n=1 Tax=Pseudomonas sp. NPDC086566 TaxID=3390647 RepID=UPI003CFF2EAD